ncbi:FAD-dependent oxidoreductase [Gordonibacter urolithinfaciens]|uniref:FAD-dependent oxidoreductase n=1 Tax=Gordonibacter urolithinfaciens TaxID=1335613 RepID=A0A6N8IML2_9ACTN|nr:FAD-dependent oxidoreductase [Gordonibacter urolithinfaciens]MVM56070.1 FAD-dependent oxidoreductase [Gordonibacter urolithinfaciens]MVN16630.1 FAD-dependent oxidoreductase [Gordonibacter urolithinfaciens]MVN38385.1 FAD-dependent oxidoreductase [Gordonibacter urolithinfaciens]MVN57245.1 FAD-dependent oxidoreductase [Gordonibacter urolithinfaciens]MVN62436.1 FAD-dependent oxidoreductase [Gordonibacter urolithinfaciens]
MSETDFDAIVVGSGCAGAVAAYELAKAGKSVLVVERGNFAGAKNMTGGRIYSHSLKKVFPDFEQEAPLERKITHERMAFMDPAAQMAVDFTSPELAEEGKDSYSVLRAPFDQWLASKAEDAGAEYICGIAVEELLKDGAGRVTGVRAGEDEITAEVTILAEGCNTVLAEKCLGNPRPKPSQMAVGIKQVFELPAAQIEDRFLVPEGEGAAMLFVGDCTHGNVGGGFLYTNKDSISLGLVATISTAADGANPHPVYQMLEDFKGHPAVAPIIRGAKLVEHSGHMVPEGGYDMVPRYVFDGCLVAGETAGLCMNMGYQVRGMDFAVASGQMAGQAAVRALDAGDTSAAGLASYKTAMENSFVIQDLETFRKWPHTMEGWSSMFTDYPIMVKEIFNALFSVDGEPQKPLLKRMMPLVKKRGLFKLAGEMRKAVKSL